MSIFRRAEAPDESGRANRRMVARLSIVVVLMFGFGFALVPFYDQICKALTARHRHRRPRDEYTGRRLRTAVNR